MPLGAVPFPFGICRICRDKATGLHYGVATCEGCKGFFKRSITKQEKFKCHFGGSCDVNPKTRSQCKACRFKRCLETGMSVDGVRMGRIPKVEKDKVLEAFHDGVSHFSNHELIVQQTNGRNYKFELNKTDATTNATCTSTKDQTSNTTTPVAVVTGIGIGGDKEKYEEKAAGGISFEAEPYNAKASGITEKFKDHPIGRTSNIDLPHDINTWSLIKETINAQNPFTEVSDNVRGKFSSFDEMEISDIKVAVQSEKCDNPFNDKYLNMGSSNSRELQQRIPQVAQQRLDDQRLVHDVNESFHKFCFSEPVVNSFEGTTPEYQTVMPFNHQGASSMSNRYTSGSSQPPNPSTSYQYGITIPRKNKIEDKQTGIASTRIATLEQDSSNDEDQGPRRRVNFSPALINVLLEQVLESHESVNVIAEKLHQKHQQGNFRQLLAQNISQRLSEMSTKRRRYSDDPLHSPLPDNNVKDNHCLENKAKCQESTSDVSLDDNYRIYSPKETKHDCTCSPNQHGHCDLPTCRKCSSYTTTVSPKYGNEQPTCNRRVSSSSLPIEEEEKLKQIRNTLDGISIAMHILNRLKAEHREKVHQHQLGKIQMRVMTDSEKDIKETYAKVIDGIPELNERILGFCNSVPGFRDIAKEDQDVLMKRAYYDIWMLSHSEYMQRGESYMILKTGEIYSQKAMRKILNDHMVDTIFEFANEFNSLELTDLEVAVLCAARLTATDGLELSDRLKVNRLHSHILDVLAFEVKQNHEMSHARKLIDIFRLMPLLETINRIQREIIAKFSI
ncbi:uncharacterized protein LOC123566440 [Mercenaria mercenaria]|uniref:uncharacterized protein LOC123566440 n=1 Tax=Mercenaria mercenaria TaxID=6596 RepID=UPI00234F65D7|nr:uncharacterized protein LOC123566440 [Mercenaria mercenaria]